MDLNSQPQSENSVPPSSPPGPSLQGGATHTPTGLSDTKRPSTALVVAGVSFVAFSVAMAAQLLLSTPKEDPGRFAYRPYPGDRTSRDPFDSAMRQRWEAQQMEAAMYGRRSSAREQRSEMSIWLVSTLIAAGAGGVAYLALKAGF